MIQRIQSVYLFLVVILMTVSMLTPLLVLSGADNQLYLLTAKGIENGLDGNIYITWGVFLIGILIALIALVEIFSYANRKRQILLSKINIFLIVLFYVTIAAYTYCFMSDVDAPIYFLKYGLVFPVVALVFNVLAMLRIIADEKLIRSTYRIR